VSAGLPSGGLFTTGPAPCGVLWRSSPEPDVPVWLFAAMGLPLLAGTALTIVAAVRDRKL
jgi:hypothetical protein